MDFRSNILKGDLCVIMTQNHVTSDTGPYCFSACNIEKLGMGRRQGYVSFVLEHTSQLHYTCLLYKISINVLAIYSLDTYETYTLFLIETN